MRIQEFTTVMMKAIGPGQVSVFEGKVKINLDAIQGLAPATTPSELAAPDGTPIATQACTVFLSGGQFTVKKSYAEMSDLWEGKSAIVS